MNRKKSKDDFEKVLGKIYSMIFSTKMLDTSKIKIDITAGEVSLRRLNRKIIECIKYLRGIKDALLTRGDAVNANLIDMFANYILTAAKDTLDIKKIWQTHNDIYENISDYDDFDADISKMASCFCEIFNDDIVSNMINFFVSFVSNSNVNDKTSHSERCIRMNYLPAPYSNTYYSFNLLSIVNLEMAMIIYNCMSDIVDSFSSLLDIHFGSVDYMIKYASMSDSMTMSNMQAVCFIKGTMDGFSIGGNIDYKFILMCIINPNMIGSYLALHTSMASLVMNMGYILAQGSSFITPDLIKFVGISN